MRVGERIDDRHRPGERVLDRVIRLGPEQPHVFAVHRPRTRERPDDLRNFRVVALADTHRHEVVEVDALEVLEITGDEVAP